MDDQDGERDRTIVAGWHAHWFEVAYNALQFRVYCGQERNEGEILTVYFRLVADPAQARQLFRLLGAGLIRYADTLGPIEADPPAAPGELEA
jgi:hypothetical protein